ncbi:MAG: response regulator [Deltaproteobacteria bacterium]|jgi:twitching motility two-component system response regulator PilH|nr:response regulator [Desulfobacterales bacterium]MDL1982591.1 response regulator [Deltaproteobacteria bacterium]
MAKKVLIVDDDVDVRTFSSSVVEDSGYKPEIAKDGEEGMGKVKEEKPALIILDILMPKESGIKMYRALKTDSQFSDIPVIVLSGIAKRTFLRSQKALDEFGDQPVPEPEAYLEKPVEPEELGAMIKKLLS